MADASFRRRRVVALCPVQAVAQVAPVAMVVVAAEMVAVVVVKVAAAVSAVAPQQHFVFPHPVRALRRRPVVGVAHPAAAAVVRRVSSDAARRSVVASKNLSRRRHRALRRAKPRCLKARSLLHVASRFKSSRPN